MRKTAAAAVSVLALAVFAPDRASAASLEELAKAEGQLTVIALPHDWCGYGLAIDGFKKRYGLAVNELNPNANSGEQVEALKANTNNAGPQAPDTVEVGVSFGVAAKADGLVQPYKVSTWATIPAAAKDPDGFWYGDAYGVLAFEINADIVKKLPADWADLLRPEYQHSVALTDSPRTSNQAVQSVYAAGLASTGGKAAGAAEAGLKFFAALNAAGNFVPANGKTAAIAQGTTPITIRWDYLGLADRDTLKGNPPITVVVPKTGVIAGLEVQAISAHAPHPKAAKLWMEYLYSDEGQLNYIAHYCHAVRFDDLLARGKIPADILAKLPAAEDYARAIMPDMADLKAAKEIIVQQWDTAVIAKAK